MAKYVARITLKSGGHSVEVEVDANDSSQARKIIEHMYDVKHFNRPPSKKK